MSKLANFTLVAYSGKHSFYTGPEGRLTDELSPSEEGQKIHTVLKKLSYIVVDGNEIVAKRILNEEIMPIMPLYPERHWLVPLFLAKVLEASGRDMKDVVFYEETAFGYAAYDYENCKRY